MNKKRLQKLFFSLVIAGGVTSATLSNVALAEENGVKVTKSMSKESDTTDDLKLAPSSKTIGIGEETNIELTADPGNPTTFTTDNKKVASVKREGDTFVVTGLSAGKMTLTVKAKINGTEVTSEITVVEKIPVTRVKVSPKAMTLDKGDVIGLNAIIAPNNATDQEVKWTSDDDSVVSVSDTGEITALKEGDAIISATADGKTGTSKITVWKENIPVTGVTVDPQTLSLEQDQTATLNAKIQPDNATNKSVKWTSSDDAVVSVSDTGEVKALTVGKATVTVTADGGITAKTDITVTAKKVPVTGVTVDSQTLSLEKDQMTTLNAKIQPDNATDKSVKWTSSDDAVVSVSNTGEVKALAVGKATVTVTTDDGGKTAKTDITVTDKKIPVTGVIVSPTLTVEKGEASSLNVTVLPATATNKKFKVTSADPTIAEVIIGEIFSALKAGKTTMTVETEDGGFKATSEITVIEEDKTIPVTGVTLEPQTLSLDKNKTAKLNAQVQPTTATNKKMKWSSSDASVVSVTSTGEVKGLKSGTATVTVETEDGGYKATTEVTVKEYIGVWEVMPSVNRIRVKAGEEIELKTPDHAFVIPTNATNKKVTWSTNNIVFISVRNGNILRGRTPGLAYVTVTAEDNNYSLNILVEVV